MPIKPKNNTNSAKGNEMLKRMTERNLTTEKSMTAQIKFKPGRLLTKPHINWLSNC